MMLDIVKSPLVTGALVAAIVSILGVLVSLLSSRWQLRAALQKLDLDFESLRQSQLREILTKRMAAYPALWSIMLTYDLNWQIEGKELDKEWAREFLAKLNKCNADYGVFFSQPVYSKFFEFREAVIAIEGKLSKDEDVTQEIKALGRIAAGEGSSPGLGTLLKDDLGSYASTVFQLRRGNRSALAS
jgi:hypothetical protein